MGQAPSTRTETTPTSDAEWAVTTTREQRTGLHTALVQLEEALAAPVPGRIADWADRVHERLVDVGAAFERHIGVTEGPGGLFDGVVRASPRLTNAVGRLQSEHESIRAAVADALVMVRTLARGEGPEAQEVRERILELLTSLSRHRQRGADLVYECYAVDLGGGD